MSQPYIGHRLLVAALLDESDSPSLKKFSPCRFVLTTLDHRGRRIKATDLLRLDIVPRPSEGTTSGLYSSVKLPWLRDISCCVFVLEAGVTELCHHMTAYLQNAFAEQKLAREPLISALRSTSMLATSPGAPVGDNAVPFRFR